MQRLEKKKQNPGPMDGNWSTRLLSFLQDRPLLRNISDLAALALFPCFAFNGVISRQTNRFALLRRGIPAHALAALLFFSLVARTSSDFFHTDGPVTTGASISAPCNACDLEATAALDAPSPPVLPPLTVSPIEPAIPQEAHPFAPAILHTQGRAPPAH